VLLEVVASDTTGLGVRADRAKVVDEVLITRLLHRIIEGFQRERTIRTRTERPTMAYNQYGGILTGAWRHTHIAAMRCAGFFGFSWIFLMASYSARPPVRTAYHNGIY
jgi:hypothetical protein